MVRYQNSQRETYAFTVFLEKRLLFSNTQIRVLNFKHAKMVPSFSDFDKIYSKVYFQIFSVKSSDSHGDHSLGISQAVIITYVSQEISWSKLSNKRRFLVVIQNSQSWSLKSKCHIFFIILIFISLRLFKNLPSYSLIDKSS